MAGKLCVLPFDVPAARLAKNRPQGGLPAQECLSNPPWPPCLRRAAHTGPDAGQGPGIGPFVQGGAIP